MSTATIQLRAESRQIRTATDDLRALERQGSATEKNINLLARGFALLASSAVLGNAVRVTANFSQEVANLAAITGAAGKDLQFYRDQAAEIGRTTTLSASQAVQAYQLIASASPQLLENADALDAVTRSAVTLAEAAGMELPAAATALGSALNQFQIDASRADEVINVLAASSKLGTAQVTSVTESLRNAAPAAKSLGVDLAETVAGIQALAAAGREGADAGTGLRQVMLRLERTGDSALRPSIVGLSGAMNELANRNMSTTALMELFGDEAFSAAAALLGQRSVLSELNVTLRGTNVAYEQASIRTNTFSGDLKALGSALEAIQIKVFSDQVDSLGRQGVQTLTGAVNLLSENLGTLATVGGVVAAVYGARLAGAVAASSVAIARNTVSAVSAKVSYDAMGVAITRTTVATNASAVAARAASASLALLGGPVGAAILAAGALYYFTDASREAERRSKALADETDNLVKKYKELNDAGRQVTISKLNAEASDYRQRLIEARAELERLQAQQIRGGSGGLGGASQVAALSRAEGKVKDLEQALGDVTGKMTALFDSTLPDEWKSLSEDIKQSSSASVELNRNFDQLTKSLQQQIIELRDGRQAADDYAIAQRLGADATESQRQAIADQVAELRALQAAQEAQSRVDSLRQGIGRDIQSGMSPLQQLESELYQRQQIIERFRQEGALSDAEARQSEIDAITAFETRKRQLYQETALQQQESLNLINWESFENRAAGALSMVATGAMSGREAIQGLAMSIVQEGIGALIKMGIQYVTTTAMQTAAATAATATTTAAAVASGAAITAAMAPAAAATSIATAGAAPAAAAPIALSTIGAIIAGLVGGAVLAGKRRQGGQVTRGNSYLVGEQGPEMITMGGNGQVTPFNQLMQRAESGSGGNSQVNLMVNISKQDGAQDSVTGRQVQDKYILDVVVGSMDSRGAVFNSVVRNTTAQGRTR